MEKRAKIVIVGAIFIILIIILSRFMESDMGAPKRPNGVPPEAIWRGVPDEGFWLLLAGVDPTTRQYRFKIYADYDGHLTLDADFKASGGAKADLPLDTGILRRVRFFEFGKIELDSGKLEMVYPAFGGSFWEIEKNKNSSLSTGVEGVVSAPGTDSLALLLKQWREDSTGCQHVRSFESFERLLKGYSLDQKNEDEILKVLGPPNAEEKYPGKLIVIYYFNSICRANKIVKGADRSMVRVSFDDQKRYLRYDPAIE